MIFFLYNLILLLSLLLLSPIILFKMIFDKRYKIGLSERLGNIPDKVVADLKNPHPHLSPLPEGEETILLPPLQGEGWGGDGVKVFSGQKEKTR